MINEIVLSYIKLYDIFEKIQIIINLLSIKKTYVFIITTKINTIKK